MRTRAYIDNEAAYEAAIARNIRRNAAKTRRVKWMEMPGAERVNDFLFRLDEFEDRFCPVTGNFLSLHPVVRVSICDFYDALRDNVNDWGGLTEKQNAAALAMIERGEKRVAEREKARAEAAARDQAASGWIGKVGDRLVLELTIRSVFERDGQYGLTFFHVMNDDAGNVVIYGGTKELGERGDRVTVKATIKDHDQREGIKQTKISRPAKV